MPTLVLPRPALPGPGHYTAKRIRDADIVELPELRGVYTWVDDEAHRATMEVAERFVSRLSERVGSERVLATVLLTDIVGSTEPASRLGDSARRELLQRHRAVVRRELARFQGRELDTAGDGFFAAFDGPARAVLAAAAIRDSLRELERRRREPRPPQQELTLERRAVQLAQREDAVAHAPTLHAGPGPGPQLGGLRYLRAMSSSARFDDPPRRDAMFADALAARAVVIVEGWSDRVALEALAERRGRDLGAEGVHVVPIGGAQAIRHVLERLVAGARDIRLAGLCDAGEERDFRRGLERAGLGSDLTRSNLEALGFYVCEADLEDELIRALGTERVERIIEAQREIGAFRTFQKQPAQQGKTAEAQLRRFMGTRSGRKIQYARLLVDGLELTRVPRPLDGVLAHV